MTEAETREHEIAYAYQCGLEDGSRLSQDMDEAQVTGLGIERGEKWAAAVLAGAQFPERL